MLTKRLSAFTFATLLIVYLLGSPGSALAGDIVYSNFMAGNETAQTGGQLTNTDFGFNLRAMAFTVADDPQIDYTLDRIELSLRGVEGGHDATLCLYSDMNDQPDMLLECMDFQFGFLRVLVVPFNGQTRLKAGYRYWVIPILRTEGSVATWLDNSAGVRGLVGDQEGTAPWSISTSTQGAFRVVGTAVPPEEIESSFSAYATTGFSTSPSTVTLFPEVFCPDSSSFYCPVPVTVPAFQTSAEVCRLLAQSINELPENSPDCTAGTPQPHGFSAVCVGNVLRVSNQSPDVCDGAFVCADRAEGLDSFRRAMSDEHVAVDGTLKLKLIGEAEGVAEDSSAENSVLVIHTRRCAPEFQPFTFRAEVPLDAGIQPGEIAAEMENKLSAIGDFDIVADGDKLIIDPPACGNLLRSPKGVPASAEGNYDVAVRINDRGLGFALTPLDEPFDSLSPPHRPRCVEPPRDMAGWWHFDESSGTTVHDIAFGHHGVRMNGGAQVPGLVSGALELDGLDDWVRIPDANVLDFFEDTDLTIDLWVKTTDAQGVVTLIDKRQDRLSPIGYSLFLADGRLGFQMADRPGSNDCSSDPSTSACTNFVSDVFVADGEWHLVTVTVDRDNPSGGRWYLDGQPAGQPFNPTIRDRSLANSSFLAIGRRSFEPQAHFEGILDELEIFRRALDADEVVTIYDAGRAGKCKNPLTIPWDTPVCRGRQSTAGQLTVCNASTEPTRYAFEFQGIPTSPPQCSVDGPTNFQTPVSFATPLVVPDDNCKTVPVTIQRPSDLTESGSTACYRAALFNLDTGEVAVNEGSIQAQDDLCPSPRRPTYGVPVGDAARVQFDFTEIELASPFLDVVVEAFGPGMEPDGAAVSLNGQPPGQILEERLEISKSAEAELVLDVSLVDFQPWTFYDLVVSMDQNGDGDLEPLASTAVISESSGCLSGLNQLCLNHGRFRAEVEWQTTQGKTAIGQAVSHTDGTGSFWFFNPSNIELGVKVLDGRAINGHFWVFIGALTNLEYTLTVTDTQTGARREYSNPLGRFASVGDTTAFSDTSGEATTTRLSTMQLSPDGIETEPDLLSHYAAYWSLATGVSASADQTLGKCISDDATSTCLQSSRFRVEVSWRDFDGNTGGGQATALTSEAGSFRFFGESNVELIVKVLDGRSINGHFWFFYGSLSNVEYTITVTDTETGEVKTYFNPLGSLRSRGDIEAF